MKQICVLFFLLACSVVALAQDDAPRAFITDSKSWEISGGGGGSSSGFGGGGGGGARPQTAEIIKTFGEKCPAVRINNKPDKADYVVLLDHEGGKGWIRKDNKVAVFDWDGDSIVSKSTRSVGSSVEEACRAIEKHWSAGGAARVASRRGSTAVVPAASKQPETQSAAKLDVASTPPGADIEVDGAFVGNTPSLLELAPGEHVLMIKKSGFKPWERKVKVTGGTVNIRAELEPAQ